MQVSLNIPWNRYGLIAELAHKLQDKCPQFGKTVLQKMVYLLQELYGVDCDCQFDLYTYGPFTSQLLQDLDLVEAVGGVKVIPVNSGTGGYKIVPGEQNESLREKAQDFLDNDSVSDAINRLIDDFGDLWAKDLELRSTIVYVAREMERSLDLLSLKELNSIVQKIKPKFTEEEIAAGIAELDSKNFIKLKE